MKEFVSKEAVKVFSLFQLGLFKKLVAFTGFYVFFAQSA